MSIAKVPSLNSLSKELSIADFRPSLLKSILFVVHDFALVFTLGIAVWYLDQFATDFWKWILWPSYWLLQGTVLWGIFVLGHDCGHESFSKSPFWNEVFGNLTHSVLLVPYWSWRLSHRHHHQNTGHIDKDEPFQPERNSRKAWKTKRSSTKAKMQRALILSLGGVWWLYLTFYSKHFKSHYWPVDPKMKKESKHVFISLGCLLGVLLGIGFCVREFGWYSVVMFYGIPLFIYASWLVLTTFLHHNDPRVVWLSDRDWSYVRGNLGTVDRSYGVFSHFTHHIGIHQIHHIFPFVPHYHLKQATARFAVKFPSLQLISQENIVVSFLKNAHNYVNHAYVDNQANEFSYGSDIAKRKSQGSPKPEFSSSHG